MQRDEILRRLEELVPEIQSSKDAEGTLLKFATEHNLAPAQLETLAQVYNNGKALTFYAKSANRGGTFKLVETEPLIERYTDHLQSHKLSEKKAGLEKVASATATDGGRFPHYRSLIESPVELEKSASVTEQLDDLSSGIAQAYFEKSAARNACAMAEELIQERMDSIRETLSSVRDEVRFDKQAFTRLEEDAHDLWGATAYRATFDKTAAFFAKSQCDVTEHRYDASKATSRSVARDTTGLLSKMASVREDLDFIAASHQFLDEFYKIAAKEQPPVMRRKKQDRPRLSDVDEEEKEPKGSPFDPKTFNIPKEPDWEKFRGGAETAPNAGGNTPVPPDVAAPDNTYEEDPEEETGRGNKEPKSQGGPKDSGILDSLLKGMSESKMKGLSAKDTFMGSKDLIRGLGDGKDRRQQKRDQAVTEDLGITSLQRLMVSDPILAQATPDEVLEHFNTINEIAPAVASDPNKLRLPLREAVQYGSIPMHTLKELLEINKLIQGNREIAYKNDAATYGGRTNVKS